MSAFSRIEPGDTADVNLTAIMRDQNIVAAKYWLAGRFSVELADGRLGIGLSVGEALEAAKQPGASNIRKVAA